MKQNELLEKVKKDLLQEFQRSGEQWEIERIFENYIEKKNTVESPVEKKSTEPTKYQEKKIKGVKNTESEDRLQAECATWAWNKYPALRMRFFSVPNESGLKNPIQVTRLKALGLVAGVADMVFFGGKTPLVFVEFKNSNGRQSDAQKEFERVARMTGNQYIIVRHKEDFMDFFCDYYGVSML